LRFLQSFATSIDRDRLTALTGCRRDGPGRREVDDIIGANNLANSFGVDDSGSSFMLVSWMRDKIASTA
jgi:hypothetical protein